jgi:hypothetical protein
MKHGIVRPFVIPSEAGNPLPSKVEWLDLRTGHQGFLDVAPRAPARNDSRRLTPSRNVKAPPKHGLGAP